MIDAALYVPFACLANVEFAAQTTPTAPMIRPCPLSSTVGLLLRPRTTWVPTLTPLKVRRILQVFYNELTADKALSSNLLASQDEVDDDGEDSRVIEDTKLVITATGDPEVLATVQHAETSHGDHDDRAAAAEREFIEDDGAENRGVATPAFVAEKEAAVPKEDDVEREAAEATTEGGETENVPVSPDFDVSQAAEEVLQPSKLSPLVPPSISAR